MTAKQEQSNIHHPSSDTLTERPPVVVVMGHIDHGKTKLLDAVRKTNVIDKESGGITQHIGAYEITYNNKHITFLDTPGHEAFSKMRMRGAHVADVAILVVAADDGVKPQTLEALQAIQKAGIPFIVALNKIDKPSADVEQVKKQLSEKEVFIEEWGGKVPLVAISAKEGLHIEELLQMVLLVAELEELTTDPSQPAGGVVVEVYLDSKRGNSATLLIENGTLRVGDFVLAGNVSTRIRILENDRGEKINTAEASMPVRVVGFDTVPVVGTEFISFPDKKTFDKAKKNLGTNITARFPQDAKNTGNSMVRIPVILKADVAGSLEALEDEIRKLTFVGAAFKFIFSGVGNIVEGDIKKVAGERGVVGALAVGFHVKVAPEAAVLSERLGVEVQTFEIIYQAVDWIKKTAEALIPKKVVKETVGTLQLLKVFKKGEGETIIGGKVLSGEVTADGQFDIMHRGRRVGGGKVKTLEAEKQKVSLVREGQLCGVSIIGEKQTEKGDELHFFIEKEAIGGETLI